MAGTRINTKSSCTAHHSDYAPINMACTKGGGGGLGALRAAAVHIKAWLMGN